MVKLIYEINEEEVKDFKTMKSSVIDVGIKAELINATEGEIRAMEHIKESAGLKKLNIVNQCKNTMNKKQVDRIDRLVKELFGI